MKFQIYFLLLPLLLLFYACDDESEKNNSAEDSLLKFETSYQTEVIEPSGLCLSKDRKSLWTVSDENSTIYNITFEGKIIDSIRVEGYDLEGICLYDNNNLAIIFERERKLAIINKEGTVLKSADINFDGEPNEGIEGVTYNGDEKIFYLIKEKNPAILVTLDSTLTEKSRDTLEIANDLSGLFYERETKNLWITSDENKIVFKCDSDGKVTESAGVDIIQIEGIAIEEPEGIVWIISDRTGKLYRYSINRK